ncbi:hypothetical protein SUGI_0444820 [Cryptomeria japonica]|nr:hypothetical protein SUGI_0444820 [Cryptomeria japonica]
MSRQAHPIEGWAESDHVKSLQITQPPGLVALYFAWRTVRSNGDQEEPEQDPLLKNGNAAPDAGIHKLSLFKRTSGAIVYGFWAFVDMASGRYLWQSMRAHTHKTKAS